jgi:hypothetical protein
VTFGSQAVGFRFFNKKTTVSGGFLGDFEAILGYLVSRQGIEP